MTLKTTVLRIAVVSLLLAAVVPSSAQSQKETAPAAVTTDDVERLIKTAAANRDLEQEQRDKIASLAERALEEIRAADTARKNLTTQQAKTKSLQEESETCAEQIRVLKAAQRDADALSPLSNAKELNKRISELLATQEQIKTEQLAANADRRTVQRQNLVADRTRLNTELNDLDAEQPAEAEVGDTVAQAAGLLRLAKLERIRMEQSAADAGLTLLDQEDALDLPRQRSELLQLRSADVERRLEQRRQQAKVQLDTAAQNRINEAREEQQQNSVAKDYGISLDAIFQRSQEIAQQAATVSSQINLTETQATARKEEISSFEQKYNNLKIMVRDIGLTESIGLRLRKQRSQLPARTDIENRLRARSPVLEQAHLDYFQTKEERAGLDIDKEVTLTIGDTSALDEFSLEQIEQEIRTALEHQAEYLTDLESLHDRYTNRLDELDRYDRQLLRQTDALRKYVDERVLWIRSHKPLGFRDFARLPQEVSEQLTGISSTGDVFRKLLADMKQRRTLYAIVGLLLALLLASGHRLRGRLAEVGESLPRRGLLHTAPTFYAILLTAVISAWPLVLWFLGWRLSLLTTSSELSALFSLRFRSLAILIFSAEFFRQSCRPHGLCEAHFLWNPAVCRQINRGMRTLFGIAVPLVIAGNLLSDASGQGNDLLERMLFIAACGTLAFVLHEFFHPKLGISTVLVHGQVDGWRERFQWLLHKLVLLIPAGCAGLVFAGFYYTASELVLKLQATVWMTGFLLLLREILLRWILVGRRRLKLNQLREKAISEQDEGTADEAHSIPIETELANADTVGEQTRRLINTTAAVAALAGIWMVWVDVLPALEFLDRWPVWSVSITETIPAESIDGEPRTIQRDQPITIADLGKCLLIVILTMTAARNIPGVLEIGLLQNLPFQPSIRYAISTLTRYAILVIGILLASQALGLSWSKVQWLAAALTFGLGFGLQEIFANFISGLILLIEQPIRVGDVVTIDGVSGVVNRIRIRATTITDWDRREYIVPNKEFIIGRLLNWTLSDKVNRVVVSVGVAYGSDVPTVSELLMKIARAHDNVLDDPSPGVTFEAFGDSALQFKLRTYLPNLENRLKTTHELNEAINAAFEEAGIEIAFPQQDLNIRSLPASFPRA